MDLFFLVGPLRVIWVKFSYGPICNDSFCHILEGDSLRIIFASLILLNFLLK